MSESTLQASPNNRLCGNDYWLFVKITSKKVEHVHAEDNLLGIQLENYGYTYRIVPTG